MTSPDMLRARRARRGWPLLLLLLAEGLVTPLGQLWRGYLPDRCHTPAEAIVNVGVFAGLQREARRLGFDPVGQGRLASWVMGLRQLRQMAGPMQWAALCLPIVLAVALLRGRRVGAVAAGAWCVWGACFSTARLLALPVDKPAVQLGCRAVGLMALHSAAALSLYGGAAFLLLPLSGRQRRTALGCGALLLAALVAYEANLRPLGTGDTFAAPYVAVSLLREGDFDLDEFEWARGEYSTIDPRSNGAIEVAGRLVSRYPALSSVLAAPVFAAYFFVPWLGTPDNEFLLQLVGKVAAGIFAALSVVGVYLAVRGLCGRWALVCALVYGFGTCTWFVSQALWQHSACEMALAWALCFLVRAGRDKRFVGWAGFALAAALAARYAAAGIVAVLGAYALWQHRRHWVRFVAGALPVAVLQLAYNWRYFGSPLISGYQTEAWQAWQTPFLAGLAGHLVGPSRGLFVFSPVMLFAVAGAVAGWRERSGHRALVRALAIAVAAHVALLSKWSPWHGGLSYGYRMIVEVCPLLALLLAVGLERWWRRPAVRTGFVLASILSVAVQIIGVFCFDGQWQMATGTAPAQHRSLSKSQIAFYFARNRWYVTRLAHQPCLHLAGKAFQITASGVFQDQAPDYPRALLLEQPPPRPRPRSR